MLLLLLVAINEFLVVCLKNKMSINVIMGWLMVIVMGNTMVLDLGMNYI